MTKMGYIFCIIFINSNGNITNYKGCLHGIFNCTAAPSTLEFYFLV